jgi:hypothetical protein
MDLLDSREFVYLIGTSIMVMALSQCSTMITDFCIYLYIAVINLHFILKKKFNKAILLEKVKAKALMLMLLGKQDL